MGEKNDRTLKGIRIVPEGRLQGNDITFTLPCPGVLDISLGEEVRPGPSNPHRTKDKKRPIFDTLFKKFNPKPYPV